MTTKPHTRWIADYYGITLSFPVFGPLDGRYKELANSIIEVPSDGDWKRPCTVLKNREGKPFLEVATMAWESGGRSGIGFVFDPLPGEHLVFSFDDLRNQSGNVDVLLKRYAEGVL